MKLEELKVYQESMEIAEDIWQIVIDWDYFVYPVKSRNSENCTNGMNKLFHGAKDTIGKQLVRAIDSVAANLSEGFGRYHYKENKNFCYYSRGSLYESKTWLTKARNRNLISEKKYDLLIIFIDNVAIKLNNYINSIGRKSSK